jgi:hypothetical protein
VGSDNNEFARCENERDPIYERRSEIMDSNMILQAVIWIAAGAALVTLMMRRKNRKAAR